MSLANTRTVLNIQYFVIQVLKYQNHQNKKDRPQVEVGTSDSTVIAKGSSSKACDPNLKSFWQYTAGKESGAD